MPQPVPFKDKKSARAKKTRRTVYLSEFNDWEIEQYVKEGSLGDSPSEVIRFLVQYALTHLPRRSRLPNK